MLQKNPLKIDFWKSQSFAQQNEGGSSLRKNPFKRKSPKKIKNDFSQKGLPSSNEILRSTFSMIFKKSTLEGVFDFFIQTPNLTKI